MKKGIVRRAKDRLIRWLGGYVNPFDAPIEYKITEVEPVKCMGVAAACAEPFIPAKILRQYAEDAAIKKLVENLRDGGFIEIDLFDHAEYPLSDEEYEHYSGDLHVRATLNVIPPQYPTRTSLTWYPLEEE